MFLWSGAYYVCARLVEKTRNQEDLDDPREDDEDEHDDSDLEVEMHWEWGATGLSREKKETGAWDTRHDSKEKQNATLIMEPTTRAKTS